jgi:hypothetical protein
MVGLGESFEEMVDTFRVLREHGVQILTVGQYLRPTERHLPVVRYWEPEEFDRLRDAALALGFESVAAGPLVRSSYHADEAAAEVAARRAAEKAQTKLTGPPRVFGACRPGGCDSRLRRWWWPPRWHRARLVILRRSRMR